MIKKYNFIIEGKIIDVYATSSEEAHEKAMNIFNELSTTEYSIKSVALSQFVLASATFFIPFL